MQQSIYDNVTNRIIEELEKALRHGLNPGTLQLARIKT